MNISIPSGLNHMNHTWIASKLREVGLNITWTDGLARSMPTINWTMANCSWAPNSTWRTGSDWLFKTPTLMCGCGEWDNNVTTRFSWAFFVLLHVVLGSLAVALCHPALGGEDVGTDHAPCCNETSGSDSRDSEDDTDAASHRTPQQRSSRLWYVDFGRFCAIFCVVAEHSGAENYTQNNVVLVQQWVVPFLYAASGVSFMLSSSHLGQYMFRLLIIFCIGVGFNWIALFISGRLTDPVGTMYQMGYVVCLMGLAVYTQPLKQAFAWRRRHSGMGNPLPAHLWCLLLLVFTPGFFLTTLFLSGITTESLGWQESQKALAPGAAFTESGPILGAQYVGLAMITMSCVSVGSSGWVFWILLVVSTSLQTFIPYRSVAHQFRGDLYVLGMVAHAWPMKGKDMVVNIFQKYWFLFVFGFYLATPPVQGRCDLDPMNTWWERMRFRGTEAVLLAIFLAGGMHCDDPHGLMGWLNWWGLWAFCSHLFFSILLPVPIGACVTWGSMAPFLMLAFRDWQRRRQAETETSKLLLNN